MQILRPENPSVCLTPSLLEFIVQNSDDYRQIDDRQTDRQTHTHTHTQTHTDTHTHTHTQNKIN